MNVEQIKNELLIVNSDILTCCTRLYYECGEVTNTMKKSQEIFGDQQAGQELVNVLYEVLKNLTDSKNTLQILSKDIQNYIQRIQK